MSWFIPYNQLDNEQLNFLQEIGSDHESNFWLKGYAGSGKSVLLIHCLLKEKEARPNSSVIIVLYTHALIDMIRAGIPAQYNNTQVVTYHKFRHMHGTWDLVLVDEVQDLPEYIIRELFSKGRRVIVAGDVNQSIYDNVCPTESISAILGGKSFSLRIIHRISRRIRQVAQFFCSDRDGFNSATMGRLVELLPRLIKATSYEEECRWIISSAKEYGHSGYVPAVLIPNHRLIFTFIQTLLQLENKPLMPQAYFGNARANYLRINAHLRSNGLKFQYLGNGAGSFEEASQESLVTIMTYHSAKGLDFRAVFIPFLTPDLDIWSDPISRARTLFFVSVTRSREQLFLSYHGNSKHPFLQEIPDDHFHNLSASEEIIRMNNPNGNPDEKETIVVF